MSARPASETVRSPGWIAAVLATLVALGFVYFPLLAYCVREWVNKPEYSHGFFVPAFAAYMAWRWRDRAPNTIQWPDPWGTGFVVAGAGLFVVAGIANTGKEWLQGLSLVFNLSGATLLLGGRQVFRWLWPSLVFLLFMFPLPYQVEHWLGWYLQKIATAASTFLLQTIGYPAYSEGNIIHVRGQVLEVANACNGLSMLLTFLALATAMAVTVNRPWPDRGLILVSAVPIAVVSNVVRIVVTGVLYVEAGKELGDRVFHDFAGWLMMPLALFFIWLELKLLDWVYVEELGRASREEVIKANTGNPAYLFMANNPGLGAEAVKHPPGKSTARVPRKGR